MCNDEKRYREAIKMAASVVSIRIDECAWKGWYKQLSSLLRCFGVPIHRVYEYGILKYERSRWNIASMRRGGLRAVSMHSDNGKRGFLKRFRFCNSSACRDSRGDGKR